MVATLSFHKIILRLVDGSNKWVARADFLEYGQHGVIDLKDQLQDEGRDANATEDGLTRLSGRPRRGQYSNQWRAADLTKTS